MALKSMGLTVLSVFALLYAQTINGFTVELIHPNSLSNPNRNPSNSQFHWIRQAYNHTRSRAASIQSSLGGGGSAKFKTDIESYGGGYAMKYSLGTPPFEIYGIADTGSDVTWTQCEPCINCFSQSLPLFDPKHSKSYKTVSCDSDACTLVKSNGGPGAGECSGENVCQYQLTYGDNTQSIGDVATDTLTIGGASFKNVVFGCGHKNRATSYGNATHNATGVVGLGYSNGSIVTQLDKDFGGKFAYCLSSQPDSKSHISFGKDAIVNGTGAVSTPFDAGPYNSTLYYLSLESISIGNQSIPFKKSVSSNVGGRRAGIKKTSANGNIVIDSGTGVTIIPPNEFDNLKSELTKQIPATPIDDPQGQYSLCYSTIDKIEVPKIVAHFSGADVELSPRGSYIEVEEGISCFTIIPDIGFETFIFGSLSVVDYLIGYDLEAQTVTFKSTDCSKY
ncbi:PREDICTED: aspartic proteinase CDR1-like [Ipomoea nil]|uniref:aspartic proteinase CDR1-like n=1 Tax=Ipomoea nil TaxID=35883 RepID=UPI000900A245|nr:PREDICTED: aspartic proteinase CDR1-like [Ipomoea nil]